MFNRWSRIAFIAAATVVTPIAAHASEYLLTYEFNAVADVYPVDGYTLDDHFTLSGKGSGILDFDNNLVSASGANSELVFYSNSAFFLQAGISPFEFEVDGYSDPQPSLGTHTFSFGLSDVVSDPYAPNGGGLYIEGGYDGDGFTQGPTFSVTGSFTVSELSTVPLPAAAPMFGAALLALAGFGHGVNRWATPKNRKNESAA